MISIFFFVLTNLSVNHEFYLGDEPVLKFVNEFGDKLITSYILTVCG